MWVLIFSTDLSKIFFFHSKKKLSEIMIKKYVYPYVKYRFFLSYFNYT